MKKFLRDITIIVAIVISFMLLFDAIYSFTFQSGKPRNKIQKIFQMKNQHYEFAFFGSSRVENHIDCALIEEITGKSCINLGITGGSLGDVRVLLKVAGDNDVTFNNVFVQIDYNYNRHGISKYFKAGLAPFINNAIIADDLRNDKNFFWESHVPFYRFMLNDKQLGFREFFVMLVRKEPRVNLNVGFLPKYGKGLEVAGAFPSKFRMENEDLESIRKIGAKNGFKIDYFTSPYCDRIENRENVSLLISRIPSLYNYISIFDDNDDYFFNCGHLNFEGAQEFTKIIIEDMLINKE